MNKEKKNLFIISCLIVIFAIFLRIFSALLPYNTAIISGEYIFSLDYSEHVRRLHYITNWSNFSSYISCLDCWSINHYSNYFSLIYFAISLIGEKLGFFPLYFYIFVNLSSQLIATYFSILLINNRTSLLTVFATFLIFSLNTYKVSLIASGSWYGLTHALLLIYFSILINFLTNIEKMPMSKIANLASAFGVLLGLSISLTVNYLPYTFYLTLFILIFFIKKIAVNYKRALLFAFLAAMPTLLILFPIYTSYIDGNNNIAKNFSSPANNEAFFNALTFRQWETFKSPIAKICFLFLFLSPFAFFFLNSKNKAKNKILLLASLVIAILLLMGNNIRPNLYLFIFENVPLMSSMRSSHRLYFFVMYIYTFLISSWFLDKKKSNFLKILWLSMFATILLIPNYLTIKNRVTVRYLPSEYFDVAAYFKKNNDNVLYLPAYPPLHKNLTNSFDWGQSTSDVITIYSNPFTAYLPFNGLVSFEQYHYPEYGISPIMNYAGSELSEFLKTSNILYLIKDNHFDWSLYPNFKLDSKLFSLEREFGEIEIYKVR